MHAHREDTTKMTGHFDGYVEVHSKDEEAVMEALMKHGPLAVGVDADFDFVFYRQGHTGTAHKAASLHTCSMRDRQCMRSACSTST